MARGFTKKSVRKVAESEGFRQVAETAGFVKYSHEQRDGGCCVEVFLGSRSIQITMDKVWQGRKDSIILRSVERGNLLKIFRNPGAKIRYRKSNPYYVAYRLNNAESRRFFMSANSPIGKTIIFYEYYNDYTSGREFE